MSKSNDAIIYLVNGGLRKIDTENGIVLNLQGLPYSLKPDKDGYNTIAVYHNKRTYKVYVHRVIAYAIYGLSALLPGFEIDHINRKRKDNRGTNLRIVPLLHHRKREHWFTQIMFAVSDDVGDIQAAFVTKEDADDYASRKGGELHVWKT